MFCPGSLVCMALAEKLQPHVTVQDCSVLRESQRLPAWLNGTPLYVDEEDAIPRRGRDAIAYMSEMHREWKKTQATVPGTPRRPAAIVRPEAVAFSPVAAPSATPEFQQEEHAGPIDIFENPSGQDPGEGGADPFENPAGHLHGAQATIADNGKVTAADLEKFMQGRKQLAPRPSE